MRSMVEGTLSAYHASFPSSPHLPAPSVMPTACHLPVPGRIG
jgi:hypothetical protein